MKDRVFPRQGTDKDLFERLSEYISYFDKNWKDKIEGASDEEIEKFQNIYKIVDKDFKIPESLYMYLKNMGKKDEVFIKYESIDINYMIEYNEFYVINLYLNNSEKINCILLSEGNISEKMLILDLTKNGQISVINSNEYIGYEPNGISKYFIEERYDEKFENFVKEKNNESLLEEYNWWKKSVQNGKEGGWFEEFKSKLIKQKFNTLGMEIKIEPISKNLENLLFQTIFVIYERFDNYIRIDNANENNTRDKNIKENIENILKKYNIKRTWFDDGIRNNGKDYYGYGDGVSICLCFYSFVQANIDFGLSGFITGENKELVEKIYNEIDALLIK